MTLRYQPFNPFILAHKSDKCIMSHIFISNRQAWIMCCH